MSVTRAFRRLWQWQDVNADSIADGETLVWDAAAEEFIPGASGGGGGGAPTTVDYLVGTASGDLSAEIVVGTSPGGELGGTWASPTVDATHSGSSHASVQAAAEATAAAALSAHEADTTSVHGIADTSAIETTSGAQAKVDAHVNDTSDAHDASAISVADIGGYFAGTDVEAALQQLGASGGGVSDHGALTGLGDDDHAQYLVVAPAASARNVITAGGAAVIPLTVKAAAAHTANLQEWQNSSGSILASLEASGRLRFPTTIPSGFLTATRTGGARTWVVLNDGDTGAHQLNAEVASYALTVTNYSGGQPSVYFAGAHSTQFGLRVIGGTAAGAVARLDAGAAGQTGLIVRAAASHTANLQEWQNSAGTALAAVLAGGAVEMREQADPAAPAADKARVFVRDNGSGKTQLCVRFPTGAVQVIATEP